jgi:hypothetical protein
MTEKLHMLRIGSLGCLLVCGVVVLGSHAAVAQQQQVQLTSPFHIINDSFYENFGLGWGLDHRGPNGGWFFNTGPANSTPPPFGGYDPGADARFGFFAGNGNTRFNFNWLGSQGSNRSHVMQAPTVVVPNGGTGYFFDGSVRPFVTGVVPVVGTGQFAQGTPLLPQASASPLQERLDRLQQENEIAQAQPPEVVPPAPDNEPVQDEAPLILGGDRGAGDAFAGGRTVRGSAAGSTANHGDISVAEIRRQQAAADAARQEEILLRIEQARGYEEAGKPGIAKIYYQQAATRAEGDLKKQLLEKIRSLDD